MNEERIVGVAIKVGHTTFWQELPTRTSEIIEKLTGTGIKRFMIKEGFMTSSGRFVDRREAYIVARKAGQLKRGTSDIEWLFMVDLVFQT